MYYRGLFLFTFILYLISLNAEQNDTYVVPNSTQYPFGDENLLKESILDNSSDARCSLTEQGQQQRLRASCGGVETSNETILDPYITCPGYAVIPPPHEVLYSSPELPAPRVQCKKCNLRVLADSTAVVVECSQCFDIPGAQGRANRTERDLLYKAFYVEVANYTSVKVTGTENI